MNKHAKNSVSDRSASTEGDFSSINPFSKPDSVGRGIYFFLQEMREEHFDKQDQKRKAQEKEAVLEELRLMFCLKMAVLAKQKGAEGSMPDIFRQSQSIFQLMLALRQKEVVVESKRFFLNRILKKSFFGFVFRNPRNQFEMTDLGKEIMDEYQQTCIDMFAKLDLEKLVQAQRKIFRRAMESPELEDYTEIPDTNSPSPILQSLVFPEDLEKKTPQVLVQIPDQAKSPQQNSTSQTLKNEQTKKMLTTVWQIEDQNTATDSDEQVISSSDIIFEDTNDQPKALTEQQSKAVKSLLERDLKADIKTMPETGLLIEEALDKLWDQVTVPTDTESQAPLTPDYASNPEWTAQPLPLSKPKNQ